MRIARRLVSALALLCLSIWVGAFTFYAGVVVDALHDEFGSLAAGEISRRVSVVLNGLGLAAVVLWWLRLAATGRADGRRPRWVEAILTGVATLCAVALIALHRSLEAHLDSVGLKGFYGLHRIYLAINTIQWLASVTLLVWACGRTAGSRSTAGHGSILVDP